MFPPYAPDPAERPEPRLSIQQRIMLFAIDHGVTDLDWEDVAEMTVLEFAALCAGPTVDGIVRDMAACGSGSGAGAGGS